MTRAAPADVDYVLPLRWTVAQDREGRDELTAYLRWLRGVARVVVVDGSDEDVFEGHAAAWGDLVEHVRPEPTAATNGKVVGVTTGIRLARSEAVVIADDDVRYDDASLAAVVRLLEHADLVGPQNVFDPMPWHATWDSARSLLNRAVAADYPGTFAVRRSTFLRMGGYSGDVLFENLELMRTVRAHGGRVVRPLDVYVRRLPTSTSGFWSQRVRQAYDDLAQPWRLVGYLGLVPLALSGRAGRRLVGVVLMAAPVVAEIGRRRAGGRTHFPVAASLMAPVWMAERAVCSWLAVSQLVRGGVRYAGRRQPVAAHSSRRLRRGATRGRPLVSAGGPEPGDLVRAVAERLQGRAAAPAEGDGATAGVDDLAVGADDAHVTAHEQGTVRVRRDGRDVVQTHVVERSA